MWSIYSLSLYSVVVMSEAEGSVLLKEAFILKLCAFFVKVSCREGMNWWSNDVSRAYENHFRVLETALPCCGQTASLNDLKYDFQCAFASCAILIMNPWSIVEEEVIAHVQEVLGSELTVIHALY